jgi:hypothetical protein
MHLFDLGRRGRKWLKLEKYSPGVAPNFIPPKALKNISHFVLRWLINNIGVGKK